MILIGEAKSEGPVPVMLRAMALSNADRSRVRLLTEGIIDRSAVTEWVGIPPPEDYADSVILKTWAEGPRPVGWFYGEGHRAAWPRDLLAVKIAESGVRA